MRFEIKLGKGYMDVAHPPIGDIVAKVNTRIHRSGQTKLLLGGTPLVSILVFAVAPVWAAGAVLLAGMGLYWLFERDRQRHRVTTLNYSLDHDMKVRFSTIQRACRVLATSQKIWLEEARQLVQDRHRHTGASHSVNFDAAAVKVLCTSPPFIDTNLTVWGLQVGDLSLFFMPDYILLWRQKLYSAIAYSAFNVQFERERVNLRGAIPKDAKLLGNAWQNPAPETLASPQPPANSRLVQVEYGLLTLIANIGLSIKLHISNVLVAEQFASLFQSVQEWLSPHMADESVHTAHEDAPQPHPSRRQKPAHEILGVAPNATLPEIRAAYHQLAQMNHPDKVVGLAPEFRILAERRMKIITAAYKAMSQRVR